MACATFDCIGKTLVKTLNSAMEHTGLQNILFSGGVSGSVYLKQKLEENLLKRAALYFAPPEYARDNALGIAYLGKKAYYDQHI